MVEEGRKEGRMVKEGRKEGEGRKDGKGRKEGGGRKKGMLLTNLCFLELEIKLCRVVDLAVISTEFIRTQDPIGWSCNLLDFVF